jgi:predicted glycoside hydrolase/deacetylase ChbG (UPF0249 family)
MAIENEIPDWLRVYFQRALLGEIYPNVRKIVASLSENNELLVRYYLDREPNESDYESIETLQTELSAMTTRQEIRTSNGECVYSNLPSGKLDPLQGIIFSRKDNAE